MVNTLVLPWWDAGSPVGAPGCRQGLGDCVRDCMELGCCHDPVSGICTVDFTTYKIIAKVNLFFKKLIFIYLFIFFSVFQYK